MQRNTIKKTINDFYELGKRYIDIGKRFKEFGYTLDAIAAYEEAKKNFKAALNLKTLFPLIEMGKTSLKHNRPDQAIIHFTKAIEVFASGVIHGYRGHAYLQNNNLAEAMSDYETAINLNIDTPCVWNNIGVVFSQQNNVEQAIYKLNNAILFANSETVYENDSCAYLENGIMKQAISAYHNSVDILYYNRANFYLKNNCLQQAINDYKKVLEFRPEWSAAWYGLGEAYFKFHNCEAAIFALSRAIEFDNENSNAYLKRGKVYAEMGEDDLALCDFNLAIRFDANNAKAFYASGMSFYAQKQDKLALENIEKAIKLKPNHEKYSKKYKELEAEQNFVNEINKSLTQEKEKIEDTSIKKRFN